MARWQVETGVAHGRGFSEQDANGFLAKFTNFMKRPAADGTPQAFTADAGTNNISCTGHGYVDGESVSVSNSGGALPAPLAAATEYFIIYVDADTFQVASTYSNAMSGNEIDITGAGTGTHSAYSLGGGAGWNIFDDLTDVSAKNFATTDVNTSTEEITIIGHGLHTGRAIVFSTTGTLPAGLTAGVEYYCIRSGADTIKVASSYSSSYAGTAINITSTGSGTHTLTPRDPSIVFCDTISPLVNAISTGPSGGPPKFLKAMMPTSTAGYVYFYKAIWHDTTYHFTAGIWSGQRMATSDDADFIYNFRGGDEGVGIHDLIGATWHEIVWDEMVGDSNLVEGSDKYGVLQSGVAAGTSVVLQLAAGQAANFTENRYYYIFDFSAVNSTAGRLESRVQYVLVNDVDTGTDQITVSSLTYSFSSGSVIAAYAHRWFSFGDGYTVSSLTNINYSQCKMPYSSHYNSGTAGYSFHNQTGEIRGAFAITWLSGYLSCMNPNDEGYQAVMRPAVFEVYIENAASNSSGQNRGYGTIKNTYLSRVNSMAAGISGLVINLRNYLYIKTADSVLGYGTSEFAVLVLDSESTS